MNGAQGQSNFTGHQMATNGTQDQQSINHINGTNSSNAVQINYSRAMFTPHGTYTPESHTQGQPGLAGQQVFNHVNGGINTMPIRSHANAQHVQHAQHQVQPGFPGNHLVNSTGLDPMTVIQTNPNAIAAFCNLWAALVPQTGQAQNLQAEQIPQSFQNTGATNQTTNYAVYENSSGGNTTPALTNHAQVTNHGIPSYPAAVNHHTGSGCPPQAVSPTEAVVTPNAGTEDPTQPANGTELSEDFEMHVKELLKERGTEYRGYIRNKADFARYEQAVKAAKGNSKAEDKSTGCPRNESERLEIIRRIFDAFFKLDGEQDPVSDSANENCTAFKAVRGTSPIEVEILADKLIDKMLSVQRGERITAKVVQEEDFVAKVNSVVEALSFNKLLCRSATTTEEWLARIAADPAAERRQKKDNRKNNFNKNSVLHEEAAKRGTARAKGKGTGKGKGKRAAEAEPEAVTEDSDPSRPTKRARTTKSTSQPAPAQPQAPVLQQQQVQQIQPTAAMQSYSLNHPTNVSAPQGSANWNLGAFGQTHLHNNPSPVQNQQAQQTQQAYGTFAYDTPDHGMVNQSLDPNVNAFAQNNLHNNQTTDGAAFSSEGAFVPAQTSSGAANGYDGFVSTDENQYMGRNTTSGSSEQGQCTSMGVTNQSEEQIAIQEQNLVQMQRSLLFPNEQPPVEPRQAIQSCQPVLHPAEPQQAVHHEQAVLGEFSEAEWMQSLGEDDLFGEMLAPLARYNAEN